VKVAVVGAGIIGLAIAWRLRQRGADVVVYDSGEVGAWWVAAGMLAPTGEAGFGEEPLGRLMAESARRWPSFAAELASSPSPVGSLSPAGPLSSREEDSQPSNSADLGYDDAGTLHIALTEDDVAEARRIWAHQGLTELRPAKLRELEPALSPRIRAGAHAPGDRQVDPRLVVAALQTTGIPIVEERVVALTSIDADKVVVAAGCGTAALTGLPIRPVKGQVLRLRGEPGRLRHVIHAAGVYLVPRRDGEIIVGATQEERADPTITAGAVLSLLRAAVDLVPGLADYELVETIAGHRPGTPDNAPLLGRLDGRTVVAAGHFRNGVLLTPITADLIADLVLSGVTDPLLEPFAPRRPACT
jgi:glycine oxidase